MRDPGSASARRQHPPPPPFARRPQLFCLESADDTAGPFRHQLLQLAKLHARPAVIYASAKAEGALLEALRQPLLPCATAARSTHDDAGAATAAGVAEGPAPDGCFDVRTERSSLFQPRQARAVLEAVCLRSWPPGLGARERLHRLNAAMSLSSEQQVCAAGALLAVLAREGRLALGGGAWEAGAPVGAATDADSCNGGVAAAGGAAPTELLSIQEVSLDGYLLVDPASQAALQIFTPEAHPAASMGIGVCEEGGACWLCPAVGCSSGSGVPWPLPACTPALASHLPCMVCMLPAGGQPKEGFSVFGLLNTCVSPGGRRLLRLWFARPIVRPGRAGAAHSPPCQLCARERSCANRPVKVLCLHTGQPEKAL